MGIVDEDIARVREATDVAAIIGEQVALKRVGSRLQGLCPFHAEKSPSFSVNAAEGLYYCFGCQARGDVITFVRETQHLDFVGAVEFLAARSGIQLRYDNPEATRDHSRKSTLTHAMETAVDWYHERLLTGSDAGGARRYLRERGYDAATVRAFKLGWAPEGWDELCRALHAPPEVMVDAGLAGRSSRGTLIDSFRGRVMFPIFEVDGKPVALGGRILPGGQGPKYKNSQEGPLYSKRRVLYGLNWAKADVVSAGEVIVCEGYTDVIAFHRAGLPRAVATCGTALADEHMAKLKNFARRIVLAYDADSAGQGAAEKFYAWEQKLELEIRVLRLPPGADPGSTDPEVLRQAVGDARPFLQFRIERLREAADLSTAEGRSRYSDRALEAIAAHPDDLVRDQYLMDVSDWARVPAERLRTRLEDIRRRPPTPPPAEKVRRDRSSEPRPADPGDAPRGAPDPWEGMSLGPGAARRAGDAPTGGRTATRAVHRGQAVEEAALRLAVHRPEEVAMLLEEVLFDDPLYRAAFVALLAAPTLTEAIEAAEPPIAELLHRLAVEEPDPEAPPDDVLANLVRLAAFRKLAAIEADARINQTVVGLGWSKQRIESLADPDQRVQAASQLVAWLTGANEEDA